MGPCQMLPLPARVDPSAMTLKDYYPFSKSPALLETHHQNVISGTLVWHVLPLSREAVGVFCSPCRPSKVYWTLFSILSNINNVVVRMAPTCPLLSLSSFLYSLLTVLSAPVTTGFTITFMFHNYYYSLEFFTLA